MPSVFRTFVLRNEPNAQALWQFLKNNWRALADSGKPLAVIVQEHKAKRSIEQNKRYWAILGEISEGAWFNGRRYPTEAWAEYFKLKYIGAEETPDGRLIGISTTTLNVAEFCDYVTKIEVFATNELGIEFLF